MVSSLRFSFSIKNRIQSKTACTAFFFLLAAGTVLSLPACRRRGFKKFITLHLEVSMTMLTSPQVKT